MTDMCVCGRPIRQVDLSGTAFFEHKPRRDCLTWWHEDPDYFPTHQARPQRDHVAEADELRKQVRG
ncbi:MAG TPA: hypothetical protein VF062_04985 [Candidatus Limnocylindrales bacterium]